MAVPTIYKSTDASAPTLTGQVGSLITVLDAVLVNGYGSKSGAGWIKDYSGTNLAVYRSPAGRSIHIQDDGDRIDSRFARVRGCFSASGPEVADLVDPHPATGNTTWSKSGTADGTARPWMVAATDKQLWFIPSMGIQINGFDVASPYFAGWINSYIDGDTGNFLILGHGGTASGNTNVVGIPNNVHHVYVNTWNAAGSALGCLATRFDNTGVSIDANLLSASPEGGSSLSTTRLTLAGSLFYPSRSGGLPLAPFYCFERASSGGHFMRGLIPGMCFPLVKTWLGGARPSDPYQNITLNAGYGDATFQMIPVHNQFFSANANVGNNASHYLDVSSDWDSIL